MASSVGDGAPEPDRRGPRDLHRPKNTGSSIWRMRPPGQQHDAPEEEPRSARARARQDGARDVGRLTGWLVTMKGLPRLQQGSQEDKKKPFSTWRRRCPTSSRRRPRGRLAAVVERRPHGAGRIRAAAGNRRRRLSRFAGHAVSGARTSRRRDGAPAAGRGRDFSALTLEEWRQASDMFGDDAPRAATALASVQAGGRRNPPIQPPCGKRWTNAGSWLRNPESQ